MVPTLVIFAAGAAAQGGMISQATVPPAVTLVAAPAPAPPPVVRGARMGNDVIAVDMTAVPVVPVRVRVVAGGQQLFDDTLRVSRTASASYQESRSEAPETVCAAQRYYSSQERYSFNINLYLRDETPIGPSVNVTVRWQRPSKMPACGGEGSREVQLTQTVPLAPGQSTTIQGDAGLLVTISR
jgi:hypothetical protein